MNPVTVVIIDELLLLSTLFLGRLISPFFHPGLFSFTSFNLLPPSLVYFYSSLPSRRRCIQKFVSCWWEPCRRRSGTSGWAGYAESYQPETWSRQCCRRNTDHPPERGWQICPEGGRKETKREVTKFVRMRSWLCTVDKTIRIRKMLCVTESILCQLRWSQGQAHLSDLINLRSERCACPCAHGATLVTIVCRK